MPVTKTVFITGSSTGIGRAAAELFHANSWNVVASMRNPDAGKQLAALPNMLVTKLDVTSDASIAGAVAAAIERFGRIDVLINNAGFGAYGQLEATSIETIRRQFETNVIGLLATTKAITPQFRKQRSGVIVNISSIAGRLTLPFGSLYAGTKFAIEGISESLSFEMRAIGVRVKVVEPGYIKTNFGASREFNIDPSLTEYQPLLAKFNEFVEPGRANGADPSVAAQVIYTAATDGTDQLRYLAGEDAKQLIGQRLSQDDETFFQHWRVRFGQ